MHLAWLKAWLKASRARLIGVGIATIWIILIAAGFGILYDFASTPGAESPAPAIWPKGSHLDRPPGRPILVLFLHPLCPCSRATIAELRKVLARTHGRLAVRILFVHPPGTEVNWEDSDLRESVKDLPGVVALSDPGGREAHIFGARTSGHSVLYGAEGLLAFSGGLTFARGHEGDNLGSEAVVALVRTGKKTTEATPVYGCPLERPQRPEGQQ